MRYYIMIDDSESVYGEYGYLYKEVEKSDVITPKGYIVLEDESRTYRHLEVVNMKHIAEIPKETYSHLMIKTSEGYDIAEEIEQVLKQREARIANLRIKREQFLNLAVELLEAWQVAPECDVTQAGMDINYPFPHSFEEMVARMQEWGYEEDGESWSVR